MLKGPKIIFVVVVVGLVVVFKLRKGYKWNKKYSSTKYVPNRTKGTKIVCIEIAPN